MSENGIGINNPHDKLFRETWNDLENVRSFLSHYLPRDILGLMDLSSLEICKDTFIEKELKDYYSDMLYQVKLSDRCGYVYVLFEHKSYVDGYVHLQLLEYMVKIWRLYLKQQDKERPLPGLPLVVPLLISHGPRSWPEDRVDFASLFDGPVDMLKAYVPDYRFELYDLTRYADERIRGTIMVRVALLLFKHILDADLLDKLPGILALMQDLMRQETGLRCLEVVLRYLFSTLDDVSEDKLKQMVETALSAKEGEYIMTLAEKLRMEGRMEAEIEGLRGAIELGMSIKFPNKMSEIMTEIRRIDDSELLKRITDALKTAESDSEIRAFLN